MIRIVTSDWSGGRRRDSVDVPRIHAPAGSLYQRRRGRPCRRWRSRRRRSMLESERTTTPIGCPSTWPPTSHRHYTTSTRLLRSHRRQPTRSSGRHSAHHPPCIATLDETHVASDTMQRAAVPTSCPRTTPSPMSQTDPKYGMKDMPKLRSGRARVVEATSFCVVVVHGLGLSRVPSAARACPGFGWSRMTQVPCHTRADVGTDAS